MMGLPLDWQVGRLAALLGEWLAEHPDPVGARSQLARAKGLLFVTCVKGAFVYSATLGHGLMIKRLDDYVDASTDACEWSGPVAIALLGAGFGLQVGLHKSEQVWILTNSRHVNMFESHSQLRVGAEYALSFADLGITIKADGGINRKGISADSSISASMGIFAGLSAEGAVLLSNPLETHAFYHSSHAGLKKVLRGEMRVPEDRMPNFARLLDVLDSLAGRYEPFGSSSASAASVSPADLAERESDKVSPDLDELDSDNLGPRRGEQDSGE
jgi:lipid-binding SYLF domain-containing protein